MNKTLLLACTISLAACQTAPHQNYTTSVLDQINADCEAKVAVPKFDPIRSRVSVNGQNVGLSMLNIDSFATSEEQPLISDFEEVLSTCNGAKIQLARETQNHGVAAALLSAGTHRREALSDLYAQKITYGQYNRRLAAISADFETSMSNVNNTERSLAAQQQANNIQTLRAIQENQRQNRPPPPISCTTNSIGSTAYTNCR